MRYYNLKRFARGRRRRLRGDRAARTIHLSVWPIGVVTQDRVGNESSGTIPGVHALTRASIYVTIDVMWRIINIGRSCSTVEVARDDETSIRASPLCVERSRNASELRESLAPRRLTVNFQENLPNGSPAVRERRGAVSRARESSAQRRNRVP
jgi:hypothetical protein